MNLRKLIRSILVAATLIGIMGILSAANASGQRANAEFLSEKVSFADLNLNTTQGVHALNSTRLGGSRRVADRSQAESYPQVPIESNSPSTLMACASGPRSRGSRMKRT
jgi:hypothetical protein